MEVVKYKWNLFNIKNKMEKFRYTKEGEDKCRQGIGWKKSCADCSYDMLCLFQQNQEKVWKAIHEQKKTSESN